MLVSQHFRVVFFLVCISGGGEHPRQKQDRKGIKDSDSAKDSETPCDVVEIADWRRTDELKCFHTRSVFAVHFAGDRPTGATVESDKGSSASKSGFTSVGKDLVHRLVNKEVSFDSNN